MGRRWLIALLVVAVAAPAPRTARAGDARDAQCAAYAHRGFIAGLGLTDAQIAVMSGCARDADGAWFWPTGINDPVPPITAPEDAARIRRLREALRGQLGDFHATLATLDDSLSPPTDTRANLDVSLAAYTAGATSADWGVPERATYGAQRSVNAAYGALLARFVAGPDRVVLRDYADWWARRRAAAVPPGTESRVPHLSAGGLDNALGVRRAPWPWELDRAYTLDLYLRRAPDEGTVPPSSSPSTPATPAGGPGTPAVGAGTPATAVDLELIDIGFDKKELAIPADTDVVFRLTNKGATQHTFNIDGLNIHSGTLEPGESRSVTVNAPGGTYEFYCDIPGHRESGMRGRLTVGDRASTPAATAVGRDGTPIAGTPAGTTGETQATLGGNGVVLLRAGRAGRLDLVGVGRLVGGRLPVVVRNNTTTAIMDVRVAVTVADTDGRSVAAGGDEGGMTPFSLAPGDAALGMLLLDRTDIPPDATLTFQLTARPARHRAFRVDLALAAVTLREGHLVGVARNDGTRHASDFWSVRVSCLDEAGDPSAGTWIFVADGGTPLAPGESAPFDIPTGASCSTFVAAVAAMATYD